MSRGAEGEVLLLVDKDGDGVAEAPTSVLKGQVRPPFRIHRRMERRHSPNGHDVGGVYRLWHPKKECQPRGATLITGGAQDQTVLPMASLRIQPMRKWGSVWAASLSMVACSLPVPGGLRRDIKREIGVQYSPPRWPAPLVADVYHHPGKGPASAVLLVHGGSWKADGPRWTMNGIARILANRGYVVVNASYRGTPDFKYPAPVEDLREAIRWMRKNASLYGIDPKNIATFGYSSGGHLAALVALEDRDVAAIVTVSAPFDLSLYPEDPEVCLFLGGNLKGAPDRFAQASPVNHVSRSSPPIFICHGTNDATVSPDHALRMKAAYTASGLPNQLRWLNGRGHAGALLLPGKAVKEAVDFLERSLKQRETLESQTYAPPHHRTAR